MSQVGGCAKTSERNERQTPAPKNPDSYRRRRRQQRAETPHQQQSERDNNRRRQLGERLRKSIGDCEMSAGQLPAVWGVETTQILRRYQGRSLSFSLWPSKLRKENYMTENKLAVIDSETLVDMRLPPQKFCVQTLLPHGMSILGGA